MSLGFKRLNITTVRSWNTVGTSVDSQSSSLGHRVRVMFYLHTSCRHALEWME